MVGTNERIGYGYGWGRTCRVRVGATMGMSTIRGFGTPYIWLDGRRKETVRWDGRGWDGERKVLEDEGWRRETSGACPVRRWISMGPLVVSLDSIWIFSCGRGRGNDEVSRRLILKTWS